MAAVDKEPSSVLDADSGDQKQSKGTTGDIIRKPFRIVGRVQGVYFRQFTEGVAQQLGLTGFVQNNTDDSVSGEVQGPAAAVEQMLNTLEDPVRVPEGASVTQMEKDQFMDIKEGETSFVKVSGRQ